MLKVILILVHYVNCILNNIAIILYYMLKVSYISALCLCKLYSKTDSRLCICYSKYVKSVNKVIEIFSKYVYLLIWSVNTPVL